MRYSKKFQSKKVLVAKVQQIVEAAKYNELNTEKEGIEILYDTCEEDIVEGAKFTYTNTTGQIVSATFRKCSNMDATYNEELEEQNDDLTFDYYAVNQANQNLSDFAIHHIVTTMLKRYAK